MFTEAAGKNKQPVNFYITIIFSGAVLVDPAFVFLAQVEMVTWNQRKKCDRNAFFNGHAGGFTLIEMMVVLIILALLATIVGPRVIGQQDEAMRVKAQTTIASLETAVKMYKLHMGKYPTTDQGLQALVSCPETGGDCEDWQEGGYLEKRAVPEDPWGNAYVYLCPGVHNDFDIVSYGADGAPGGEDENADIKSWEMD